MATKIGFGSKDIGNLDWEALERLGALDVEEAEAILDPFKQNYVLPQLMAFLASTTFKLERNEAGKVSVSATLRALAPKLGSDLGSITFPKGQALTKKAFIGILSFLRYKNRKAILPVGAKQVAPEWKRFNTSVPLFMSAFKEYRNLKYSEWDLTDGLLNQILDQDTIAMLSYVGTEFGWSTEDLLEFRTIARTIKTGAKAGILKHLNSTTAICKVGDEDFDKLPKLLKLMLCQTWVYQPSMYSQMSIQNINYIDSMSVALVSADIMIKPKDMDVECVW